MVEFTFWWEAQRKTPREVQIKQITVLVEEKTDADLWVKRWANSDRQLKCQIKYHQRKVAPGWTCWCRSDNHCPVVNTLSVIRVSISHYGSTTEVQKLIRKLHRSVWSCKGRAKQTWIPLQGVALLCWLSPNFLLSRKCTLFSFSSLIYTSLALCSKFTKL